MIMSRWVTVMGIACRLAWTGSWTGAPDNPSAAIAVNAMIRVIRAASAYGFRGHTSRNAPLAGSQRRLRFVWPRTGAPRRYQSSLGYELYDARL